VFVQIELTQQMGEALEALVQTGLYGQTEGEAARRLVERAIEQKIKDGLIHLGMK
jgi:Arc/MetJ-type ribon-helix-helix transcriptional regulator